MQTGQGHTALIEGQAKAKYHFKAESNSELSFNKGDTITLLRQIDDNWFEGKIANRRGIFPISYVEVYIKIFRYNQNLFEIFLLGIEANW